MKLSEEMKIKKKYCFCDGYRFSKEDMDYLITRIEHLEDNLKSLKKFRDSK